jgi:Zn-dependent protease
VVGLDFDLFLTICMVGFSFNAWIGLFNMIPLGPFDGTKVLAWSRLVYGVMVAVGVLLAFVLNRQDFFITVWGWMVGLFLG